MFTTLFTFKTYLERLTYSGFVDLLSECCGVIPQSMPHSLTQETQFDHVDFVFEIAEMETIQTDIINYVQYHLDIPVFVSTRIIQNRTIQKPL